ncbi:MAG TPA: polysaccharide biosynthesis protein [Phycisphaerae bacterium]|nr:polysaccharide biosynthesis protein [Phycisphaerae bacterium]HRY70649.1 polysaccharide biosynthesis protein [Phycisphaerae bacterium]HSA28965.1 polysaccharide biosynthesis protein [Phycisphaerae bacterium]
MTGQILSETLRNKNILITGGTGSFGHQIVRELFKYQPASIHVFSRDEKKQYDMALLYPNQANLTFNIGDIRDLERVQEAMRGIDVVFNAAALKQVPNCEYAPFEAVLTNIIGAQNVRRAAIDAGVQTVVSISTDKAVKPVNVMGMTKAVQERIMLDPSYRGTRTKFVCVRYGNVLGSRGSVVPLFCDLVQRGLPLPITNPAMTRFQLMLAESVQLVLWATVKGECGDLWVRKMPAANIVDLAKALSYGITGREDYPIATVGARPGEKIHEILVSEEEMWRAREMGDYFLIPGWAVPEDKHGPQHGDIQEYSSDRTRQMSVEEILKMLQTDGWVSANGVGPGPKALGTGMSRS